MPELEPPVRERDEARVLRRLERRDVESECAQRRHDHLRGVRSRDRRDEKCSAGRLGQRVGSARERPLDACSRREGIVQRLFAAELTRGEQSWELHEREWIAAGGAVELVRDGWRHFDLAPEEPGG